MKNRFAYFFHKIKKATRQFFSSKISSSDLWKKSSSWKYFTFNLSAENCWKSMENHYRDSKYSKFSPAAKDVERQANFLPGKSYLENHCTSCDLEMTLRIMTLKLKTLGKQLAYTQYIIWPWNITDFEGGSRETLDPAWKCVILKCYLYH